MARQLPVPLVSFGKRRLLWREALMNVADYLVAFLAANGVIPNLVDRRY
jgi:hypothetical protein